MSDETGSAKYTQIVEIDRVLHEPSRLGIVALLYMLDSADFIFVMNQTGMTWGNLSSHLSKLEEAGYLEIEKAFRGKRPTTNLRLTAAGRESFKDYVQNMRKLFKDLPV